MKTNNPGSRSRLPTIIVSFVAGWVVAFACCLFLLIMLNMLNDLSSARKRRETDEATAFFYRTVHALFEGTYNSEDGSISERALSKFRKHESNLGNKCYAEIYDNESGYHGGRVFFPSGDLFFVRITPHSEQDFVMTMFTQADWDDLWSSELRRSLPKPDEDGSD